MTSALALALPIADPDSSLTIPAIEPKIPRQSDSEFAKRSLGDEVPAPTEPAKHRIAATSVRISS